tara:strand:- start:214 stop:1107 length:894 start_codon:yes stop_codon:yes gene_type:complete
MRSYQKLINEMNLGRCVLIDGATATELERRGVPQIKNAWNGGGALSHPEILQDIHQQYIKTGARVIISNTFANCKHTLEDADQLHNFRRLNSRGVSIAIDARIKEKKTDVLVAAGISYWSFIDRYPGLHELEKNITEQVFIMKEAGADLVMLEMMVDIDRMMVAIDSVKKAELPVWVGLSCKPNIIGEMCLLNGEKLSHALNYLKSNNVDLVNIMHTDVRFVEDCLDIVQEEWDGLCGVYAHSGNMKGSEWTFDDVISPVVYTNYVSKWIKRKINLVGGCCGITTDHMLHLSKTLFN